MKYFLCVCLNFRMRFTSKHLAFWNCRQFSFNGSEWMCLGWIIRGFRIHDEWQTFWDWLFVLKEMQKLIETASMIQLEGWFEMVVGFHGFRSLVQFMFYFWRHCVTFRLGFWVFYTEVQNPAHLALYCRLFMFFLDQRSLIIVGDAYWFIYGKFIRGLSFYHLSPALKVMLLWCFHWGFSTQHQNWAWIFYGSCFVQAFWLPFIVQSTLYPWTMLATWCNY